MGETTAVLNVSSACHQDNKEKPNEFPDLLTHIDMKLDVTSLYLV